MSPRTAKPRGTKPFEIDIRIWTVLRNTARADHDSGIQHLLSSVEPHGQTLGCSLNKCSYLRVD